MNPFRTFLLAAAASTVLSAPALALDGVVASIKPVHSLVAAVMDGVAEPTLIVHGTGSEHVHSLRPSDAKALEKAKVVFWVGEGMETFLNAPLKTLAGGARIVALSEAPGLKMLPLREGGPFEAHSHDEDEHHDHDHAHEHEGHDHDDHHDDLHIWLDPLNAKALLAHISVTLGEADPENAARYAANAESYAARMDELVAEVSATLAPVREKPVVVFHDAYQYFEHRFGINVAGSITVSPDVMPGAQRLSEIRDRVRQLGATCIFAEPQFEPKLVSVVAEGTPARTGVLDPLGSNVPDGPELYFDLIRNMATSLATCVGE